MPRKTKRRTRRKRGSGEPKTLEELKASLAKYQEYHKKCENDNKGKHVESCAKVEKRLKKYTKLLKNKEKAKASWGKLKNTMKLAVPSARIKNKADSDKCVGKSAEEKFNIYCHKPYDKNTQGWPAWKKQYHDEPFTMYNYITKQAGDLGTCDGVQLSNSFVHYSPLQADYDSRDKYPNPMESCVQFKGAQDAMGFQDESYPIEFNTEDAWDNVKSFHALLPDIARDYAEELGVQNFDDNPDFWIKKYLLEQQAVFSGGKRRKKSRKKRRKSRRKRKRSRRRRRRR